MDMVRSIEIILFLRLLWFATARPSSPRGLMRHDGDIADFQALGWSHEQGHTTSMSPRDATALLRTGFLFCGGTITW